MQRRLFDNFIQFVCIYLQPVKTGRAQVNMGSLLNLKAVY